MPPAIHGRATEVVASVQSNGSIISVPSWVFLFISPIVVATRIWSRKRTGGRLGPDDYTILLSLVFALASGITMLYGCHNGYGQHKADLTAHQRYEAFKAFYLVQVTYKTSINLTKASILLLYLRIFSGVAWFRRGCRFVLASVAMYCVASVLATVFQCRPVAAAFDKSLEPSDCIDNARFWLANAGFSIATDVVILLMPMPLVYALQIPRVQKVALMMVFALGVFVVITSCLRTTTLDIQAKTTDPLYDVASTMWTIIELNVALVCACLPQIRPLLVKLFPKLMPTYYISREQQQQQQRQPPPAAAANKSKPHPGYEMHGPGGAAAAAAWHHHPHDAVYLASIRKGGSSTAGSEERILGTGGEGEERESRLQIQKTVQYSVEYSEEDPARLRR
ncbi:hypothetical protein F4780DRAFT_784544 [Xylariomycetidae sp. FL0641]|nr:hypothetical protein F4780DRAFT_784544 [Xylariomycetidae sp. FL0641]